MRHLRVAFNLGAVIFIVMYVGAEFAASAGHESSLQAPHWLLGLFLTTVALHWIGDLIEAVRCSL